MRKKLWLITQPQPTDFDTYQGAVVVAETEEDARNIHPSGDGDEWEVKSVSMGPGHSHRSWPEDPADVTVRYIGEAGPDFDDDVACVVLADYKAG